jgi:hypothetical protein
VRDRTFGVEIECIVDGYDHSEPEHTCVWDEDINDYVPEDGEHCCACEGCTDGSDSYLACDFTSNLLRSNGFSSWCDYIHPDGSGVEIPSPVLQGVDGLNELREVMELLNRNGFYTTEKDGLHVHHGAEDFFGNEVLMARLVELWEENLPHIRGLVNRSRHHNDYCISRIEQSPIEWAEFKRDKKLDSFNYSRFFSLAIRSQTVEFRLHQGTLDFEKAAAWIQFGQEFLEMAKRKSSAYTCASVNGLLRMVGTSQATNRTLRVKAAA